MNHVTVMGLMARNVELRYTATNTAVCDVAIAVNERRKGRDGQSADTVTFVECTAWGKTAETIQQYCPKGAGIAIEGRITVDQWEQDGSKRYKTKVTIERMHFVPKFEASTGDRPPTQPKPKPAAKPPIVPVDEECPF